MRYGVAVVGVLAALVVAWPADAHRDARIPEPTGDVRSALKLASIAYDIPYALLRRKAWCESRYKPRAVNPRRVGREHATGLFQFLPSTWRSTPYRRRDIFNPYANALAAAWMHRAGRGNEWSCR